MEKLTSNSEEKIFAGNYSSPESADYLSSPERKKVNKETRSYDIDGNNIEVDWVRFLPENVEDNETLTDSQKSVIYLPGWSMPSDAESSLELVQTLAEETVKDGGCSAISVTTRAENISNKSLPTEAKAVVELIKEIGVKEVVLAGYSKGSQKAANVIAEIQRNHPDIKVNGLLLFCPTGLYEQGSLELTAKFWGNALTQRFDTLSDKKLSKTYGSLTNDISSAMIKEMKKSRQNYPKRIINEISEMAKIDAAFKEVECPVILIQGKYDPVSSPEKTNDSVLISDASGFSIEQSNLLEMIFPNSSYARQIIGKESGNHGMPNYRPKTVARVASYLLRRHRRNRPQDE